MNILSLNQLALELVARDFSDGHAATASNGGPTKTSRALAIIHLAARDAYAMVTAVYAPKLSSLPPKPAGLGSDDATGAAAMLGAGIRAASRLYPDEAAYVAQQGALLTTGADPIAVFYGYQIGDAWVASRMADGSSAPQTDTLYHPAPGRHRPDPLDPGQSTLGRKWGDVTPFVLTSVSADAPLGPPPLLNSNAYADAFDDVAVNGRNNISTRSAKYRLHASIGIFWGYDGSNHLGTPPRLYNQVVIAAADFLALTAVSRFQISCVLPLEVSTGCTHSAVPGWATFLGFHPAARSPPTTPETSSISTGASIKPPTRFLPPYLEVHRSRVRDTRDDARSDKALKEFPESQIEPNGSSATNTAHGDSVHFRDATGHPRLLSGASSLNRSSGENMREFLDVGPKKASSSGSPRKLGSRESAEGEVNHAIHS